MGRAGSIPSPLCSILLGYACIAGQYHLKQLFYKNRPASQIYIFILLSVWPLAPGMTQTLCVVLQGQNSLPPPRPRSTAGLLITISIEDPTLANQERQ